jgi:hypothetical protein
MSFPFIIKNMLVHDHAKVVAGINQPIFDPYKLNTANINLFHF